MCSILNAECEKSITEIVCVTLYFTLKLNFMHITDAAVTGLILLVLYEIIISTVFVHI